MTTVPHYTEYASSAPNPPYNGTPVGCVVCATADVALAYKGLHPTDLSTLGTTMGSRCRAHFGTNHGRWLQGYYWGTCCAYLELQALGIRVKYTRLSVADLRSTVAAHKAVIIAGLYVSFPLVSQFSYSASVPARGRSDLYTGAHGVVLWEYDGTNYLLSDADFGSPGRPPVPPYSLVPRAAVEAMYASRTWPAAVMLDPRPAVPPVTGYRVHVYPTWFQRYFVANGVITGSVRQNTGGFLSGVSTPKLTAWPGHTSRSLVRIPTTRAQYGGWYVNAHGTNVRLETT